MIPLEGVVDIYCWQKLAGEGDDSTGSNEAYGVVRSIAAEILGIQPDSVPLIREKRQAPRIERRDFPLRFSISHCPGRLLLAVAIGREVGIDIERCDYPIIADVIAKYFMPVQELFQYQRTSPEKRHAHFMQWWTRKEALKKASGLDLGIVLRHFPVPVGRAPASMVVIGLKRPYRVYDLNVDCEYVATVAGVTSSEFYVNWVQR